MDATPRWWTGSRRNSARAAIAGWIVGVALFAVVLVHFAVAWHSVGLRIEQIRMLPVIGALALLGAAYGSQLVGWHGLARAVGARVPLRIDAGRWCLSLLGKYIPGKLWHAAGRVYLYRDDRISVGAIGAAVVVELLASVAAAGTIGSAFLYMSGSRLQPSLIAWLGASAALALVLALSPALDRLLARIFETLTGRRLDCDMPIRARAGAVAWIFVANLLTGLGCFVLAQGLLPLPPEFIPVFIGSLCISGLAGMAATIVPAGLGVRDGALAWLLAGHVSPDSAIVIAVTVRLWLTIGDLAAVVVGRALAKPSADGIGEHDFHHLQ